MQRSLLRLATPIRFWRTGAIAVVMAALGSARAHPADERGMVMQPSPFGVGATAQRIEASARQHGLGVFLRVRQAMPGAPLVLSPQALVLVLESAEGGTPVLMRGEGETLRSELPLRLELEPLGQNASRILIPSWGAEDLAQLPDGLAQDLAGLPDVVADALRRG